MSATGYDDDGEACGTHTFQNFLGTGHFGSFGTLIEEAALLCVDLFNLLRCGFASPMAAGQNIDGRFAGSSFVHISLFGCHGQSKLGTNGRPGVGMIGHRVEQYAIHIEQYGFGRKLRETMLLQIQFNRFHKVRRKIKRAEEAAEWIPK